MSKKTKPSAADKTVDIYVASTVSTLLHASSCLIQSHNLLVSKALDLLKESKTDEAP